MQYRDFGKTGAKVSRLGYGAMHLPIKKPDDKAPRSAITGIEESAALIRYALDRGVNYVDSAPYYNWSESETAIGQAIQGLPREKVYLSTKYPVESACGHCLRLRLELSLRKMRVEYIDFYHIWGLSWEGYIGRVASENGPLAAARKAKEEGLIRHISFSCHDSPAGCHKLIDTGDFESMLVQYNLLDRAMGECLRHAHEKGMGTAVMGPVAGGRLSVPSEVIARATGVASTAEIALRFVWAEPGIDMALSGMETPAIIDENVATASRAEALTAEEIARIDQLVAENQKLLELPCTGCGYCMPCPKGVAIPEIFRFFQWHTAFDLKGPARERYAGLGAGWQEKQKPATACEACGQCEAKCPQEIAIVEKLKEAHKALA
jgi:predicted aldo/keto reductase-like oxidoreductase